MLLSWIAIVGGLALLVWSSDRFVVGASATAYNFGIPTLIIGMIIVGFGTSAPEMFVAASASLSGNTGIAVGNAIGSNIANIGLVLGLAAVIAPLVVSSDILKREFPVLFLITAFVFILMIDGELSRVDGLILLAATLALCVWLLWLSKKKRRGDSDPLETEFAAELPKKMSTFIAVSWTLIGLTCLVVSSYMLVWGATNVAKALGVSDLLIGLTIVAVGTSLPEVAVSIAAALKKEHDIVIGNIIGSNMFNLLAVLGVGSAIKSTPIATIVLERDYLVMVVLMVALFFMAYGFRGTSQVNRFEGAILICAYFGYMLWLYFSATGMTT